MLLKKSISYFMNIMNKHIFLNFGVIPFINKEMVSLFQLHTYKFGLVYIYMYTISLICIRSKFGDCSPFSDHCKREALKSPVLFLTVCLNFR